MSPTDGVVVADARLGRRLPLAAAGQYVEFAGNGDGIYVARATVDKSDTTLEIDEDDNTSYALIRVAGRRVELIERGQGTSHLDPAKVVFTGFGPASQDHFGGELPAVPGAPAPVAVPPADRSPPPSAWSRSAAGASRSRLSEAGHGPAHGEAGRLDEGAVAPRPAGRSTVLLPVRKRGRYRVGLVARDAAGNASAAVSRRVRLR